MKKACLILCFVFFGCSQKNTTPPDIAANAVVPSARQLQYQQLETIGFIHFTINTFTDREWGYGDEGEQLFNPTELDVEQWVKTAKAGGLKELILTAKHHDGFCLWPSAYTEHSIKNSPYKDGKGDIVREFVEACRKHGLKVGLYLSPWDSNRPDYGKPEYITYYRNQLKELLTNYGEINEIWFDGANGGDGYYGGANESRKIDRKTYYDWETTWAMAKKIQPDIKIFSDKGPDVHWIGNEHGFAGETFWSMLTTDSLQVGSFKTDYLNTGDPEGRDWVVGQCDVSIRPGWFYHKAEDSLVKQPQQLMDIYYKSVGRNAILLINLPPDRRGLIHEDDVRSLTAFKQIIDDTFADNLLATAKSTASNTRAGAEKFKVENLKDENLETYWATDDSVTTATLTMNWEAPQTFDRLLLQEPVQYGQRVSAFHVEVQRGSGWETIATGTTIGYKRILRFEPVTTTALRIHIDKANNTIALAGVGIFKASTRETH